MLVYVHGLAIDAVIVENHQLSAEVTSNPVEEGSDITDHVRNHQVRLSMECVISDDPLGDELINDRESGGNVAASSQAYEYLKELREKREPITIFSKLAFYDNMVLENLTIPRSAQTGESLMFTAAFVQIEFVTNDRTAVRVSIPRAKEKEKKGYKPSKKVKKKTVPPVQINRVVDIAPWSASPFD